jgi:peptidoglycan hydrolase-like protein with peptidoglycan-binding domain
VDPSCRCCRSGPWRSMASAPGITADHNAIPRAPSATAWPAPRDPGYLRGMRLARFPALLAAAVALLAPAPANAQGAAPAPHPLAAAGWHGRAIRDPAPMRPAVASGRAGVALSVTAVQRTLWRLGYRPGPVDGIAGPRTQAAVQWFQIKHGLRRSGVADAATARELRRRMRGSRTPAPVATRSARRVAPAPAPAAAPAAVTPQPGLAPPGKAQGSVLVPLLASLLILLGTLILVNVLARGRRPRVVRVRRAARPAVPQPPARARRTPRVQPRPAAATAAVGYAAGADTSDVDRSAAVIRRACAARGWTLACLVRDRPEDPPGRPRPGLDRAVTQLTERRAQRLVVGRLTHIGGSTAEVGAALAWCARHEVDLVAVDVGLDTGTAEGRAAALCLLAIGGRARPTTPWPRTASRRRNGAPRAAGRAAAGGAAHGREGVP